MTILYFTATGNSLAVAKKLGGERLSIPRLVKENRTEFQDDVIGVICPVYCADTPKMVRQFLRNAKLTAEYVFLICTYGYQAGAALCHAVGYMQEAGRRPDYTAKILMADTALPRFEAQRQIDTLPDKKVDEQIEAIRKDIDARKQKRPEVTSKDKVIDVLYHKLGGAEIADGKAKKYIVTDQCIRCGICAKVCPADNISVTDRVAFGDRCEGCYGCVHNCPKNALHLKKEKSSVRFRNGDVSLQELIQANYEPVPQF